MRRQQRLWSILISLFLVAIVASLGRQIPTVRVLASMPDLDLHSFGPRILIISPHPDDEILAAGGLIQEALAAGSDVRVVFMTSGDGFRRGVLAEPGPRRPTPECYVSYGEKRQYESVTVLTALGLGTEQIVFLGYPDGGLAAIWWRYWSPDLPFASRTTLSATSPYADEYQSGGNYSSGSVLRDLTDILERFRPTAVLAPHPQDTHPDHWASHAFVSAALAGQRARGIEQNAAFFRYMIHRGSWHVIPSVSRGNPMLPPRDLLTGDSIWHNFSLGAQAVIGKEMAVRLYESQYRLMGTYLRNFVRPNELFAVLGNKVLPMTEHNFERHGLDIWNGVEPLIKDPKGDSVGRQVSSAGDLKGLFLMQGSEELQVGLESWSKMSPPVMYRVGIYVHSDLDGEFLRWIFRLTPGTKTVFAWEEQPLAREVQPLQVSVRDNFISLALPLDLTSIGSVLLAGAESRVGSIIVDTLSWWVIDIE